MPVPLLALLATRGPSRRPRRAQRGATVLIVALMLTTLLTFVSMAVDFTYLIMQRQRAQNAADAAAHAGMIVFTREAGDVDRVEATARAMLDRNGFPDGEVEIGAYDFDTYSYSAAGRRENAVSVTIPEEDVLQSELFLAPRLGLGLRSRGGDLRAVSAIQPRELLFVLDQSCSMSSGAKIASAKEGALLALTALRDTDPNGQDQVGFVGFGDSATLHTPLTNLHASYGALQAEWDREICLCTLDPYVKYFAAGAGQNQDTVQAWDLNSWTAINAHESEHPLASGDSHYAKWGAATLTYKCCEPHCDAALEAANPRTTDANFMAWLNTYGHGNGVLWGLQVAAQEFDDNGLGGAHRMIIVLGDGADFCPGGASNARMGAPCNTGGDLIAATQAYAQQMWEDQHVHIYPVYYGTSGATMDYYRSLATGQGEMFNPRTPAELEAVFAEIVYRSQIVLVP